ncbi:MAG: hypothetical protein AAF399_21855 [Bacteroidota bacterium]
MNKVLMFIAILLFSVAGYGQTSDRMEKDLEVMQRIFNEMLSDGNRFLSRYGDDSPQYEAGVGIIFRTPSRLGNLSIWSSSGSNAYVAPESWEFFDAETDQQIVVTQGKAKKSQGNVVIRTTPAPPAPPAATNGVAAIPKASGKNGLIDKLTRFLIDYGDFATQLKDDESIIILHKANNRRSQAVAIAGIGISSTASDADLITGDFSLKVKMKDLRAHRSGSIDEATLKSRIVLEEKESKEPEFEYRIFSQIINERTAEIKGELTKSYVDQEEGDDLLLTYRMAGLGRRGDDIEFIPDLGVIYQIQFSSPARSGVIFIDRGRNSTTKAVYDVFEKEDTYDEWLDELSGQLKEELPEVMLEYGRTLRRLPVGERLILKLNFPDCHKCNAPKQMEISIPAATLQAFDKQNKSLDAALKDVRFSESGKAKD